MKHSKVQKLIAFIALILCCVCTMSVPAYAIGEEPIKANIWIDGSTQTASQKIAVQVSVSIKDLDLCEDQLALGYHIVAPDGSIYVFEGTRTPLEQWVDGEITNIPVVIDLSVLPNVSKEKQVDIVFDIVNETEGYWFESSPGVDLETVVVEYRGGVGMKFKESIHRALQRPVVLAVNGTCVVLAVGFLIKRKRWTA